MGTFIYNLIAVTDPSGNTVTIDKTATITIIKKPTVDFNIDNNATCSGTAIHFKSIITGIIST